MQGNGDIDPVNVSSDGAVNLDPRGGWVDGTALAPGGMLNGFPEQTGGGGTTLSIDLQPSSLGDNFAPVDTGSRAEIDDVIGGLDDLQIVLDHDYRVALLDQGLQHFQKLADIIEVQAGGRLVQNIDGLAGCRRLSSLASLTRCASPPERVVACWPRWM